MKATLKVIAGLLLALAIAAPTYAQTREDSHPAAKRTEKERTETKQPDTPCVLCLKNIEHNLQNCIANAKTNSEKTACGANVKQATDDCNAQQCPKGNNKK